ncbi:Spy/CpxP family protein refolding chaperone [Rhodopila sp.]|uniref:Spy/CpxP family protein refolding chaperone n=1 Tax=Rhodopila sp. TaxID=2480087 RepID=UPI002CC20022|nr:Spy/CpxP family protein refolding chaperone [Rhodopila sp.]HVZ07103.1 Spy/CpxP family protein refolding chaperone [Rhodopila sp.]
MNINRSFLLGTALLAPLTSPIARAQTPSAPATPASPSALPPASTQPNAGTRSAATQKATEQRIQALKTQLAITTEQTPAWDAFAQAMRDNAASTDQLFQHRASSVTTMNAVDNMRSYAEIARDYAANLDRLTAAFEKLYDGLSDTQKKTADSLFRQQAVAAAQPHR